MKVFFNPAYTNFVYQNLEKNPLQFDQKVCNTCQIEKNEIYYILAKI